MLDHNLYAWGPVVVFLPTIAFLADWFLTVHGARAAARVRERWSVEGSYELNPTWVAAVDSGKWINVRVVAIAVIVLLLMAALYALAGTLADGFDRIAVSGIPIFALGAGILLLVQGPTLMNHAANFIQFRALAQPDAVSGGLRISRWLALNQTAWLYLRFAVIWLVLALASLQVFFLGGVIGCVITGVRFWRLARATRSTR